MNQSGTTRCRAAVSCWMCSGCWQSRWEALQARTASMVRHIRCRNSVSFWSLGKPKTIWIGYCSQPGLKNLPEVGRCQRTLSNVADLLTCGDKMVIMNQMAERFRAPIELQTLQSGGTLDVKSLRAQVPQRFHYACLSMCLLLLIPVLWSPSRS